MGRNSQAWPKSLKLPSGDNVTGQPLGPKSLRNKVTKEWPTSKRTIHLYINPFSAIAFGHAVGLVIEGTSCSRTLLRNRVSAQQARERKKVYVNDLESRAKELEDKNSNLEERISTLINENTMLRKVLMNTRPKVDENVEA
ncbi:hypothetical protein PIB30_065915 [Stylosanthes scabra]|uniref:BZIP domain-containing protein n=1 Tax=Stylosanthes scabra TaxID=79078 RepID=A0ABU6TMW5_9FABA|nr:hypothetical protein [Stylosanthes scabra]